MARAMRLSELQQLARDREAVREAGLTVTECTLCGDDVIERDACWDFYAGTGTVLHQTCVRLHLMVWEATGWMKLFWDEVWRHDLDRCWTRGSDGQQMTVSYSELWAKNAREHPGDSFFDCPMKQSEADDYMTMALRCAGVPQSGDGLIP